MPDIKRFVFTFPIVIFLPLLAMLVFFSRKSWVAWYQQHSQLEQMALGSLAAWVTIVLNLAILYYSFGMSLIPYLTLFFSMGGGFHFVMIQYKFKIGKMAQPAYQRGPLFDERDYRIGQEALQAAYLTFWIVLGIAGVFFYLFITPFELDIPQWVFLLIFPVMALVVSLVHAITILRLCRGDAEQELLDA